jgi:hypothetical protein
MFFAGLLSLGLPPTQLPRLLPMRRLLWIVALIALDALLGSWLYGGGYTQAIGRMLVDIETQMSQRF